MDDTPYEEEERTAVPLASLWFNPALLYTPGGLDKLLRGLSSQPSQQNDNIFTDQVEHS